MKGRFVFFMLFYVFQCSTAQSNDKPYGLGFSYGFGDEIRRKDYTFRNQFVKMQFDYRFKNGKYLKYAMVVQPELNFGEHQLLNKYFVQPDEPNYEALREEYTQIKNVREYILNLGLLVRKPLGKSFSVYLLGSIGPMVTDTRTERLSKGFAFSDVIALGFSVKTADAYFDIRPSLRHVSNGGLQSSNAGFNTQNIEICMLFDL
ncbi:acyloxyacyl hydrolase [Flavobacterium enshiense]|uniref:acyloxyacyl hydrolase n=1 Tax=Flavobacterium enshiense TaxID=1341165 RepID=UPI00345D73EF